MGVLRLTVNGSPKIQHRGLRPGPTLAGSASSMGRRKGFGAMDMCHAATHAQIG